MTDPRRILTDDQINEIVERYRTGESQGALATAYGVSRATVNKWIGRREQTHLVPIQPLLDWATRYGRELADLSERARQRIDQAREKGAIDYYHADEIACDELWVHPVSVYGPAWFSMPEDEGLQKRLAGHEDKEEAAA